jgi:NNP family nitrate/nitrite transporter-like MFS transporter
MANLRTFVRSGHWPTLLAAFLFFDFTFAVWVLNGAMGPFIGESFHLTPVQKGFMVSVPILAGALLRFPLAVLAQYIGRRNGAMVQMSLIVAALVYGYLFVDSYDRVMTMGVLLGIAGASFGVALSLGAGWFPTQYKGLAMGITGAGNSGTVLAVLFAPPLAARFGWQSVYGLAALMMSLPMAVMWFAAREPPDREQQSLREHLSCLFEKDGWIFSVIYIVTFGGFIGLSSFLPTYFYDQFQVTKVQAGQLTMLATLMGSVVRALGGHISDHIGGVNTLTVVLLLVAAMLLLCGASGGSLVASTLLFMVCFAALGAGNGALFQLVPLRWPLTTAVAGGMIGEIGALGGGFIPNAMGLSKQYLGTFFWGFASFAAVALAMLALLRVVQIRWTRTWAEKGGRARHGAVPAALPRRSGSEQARLAT